MLERASIIFDCRTLFWAAINAGGRVDSVLKDMAIAAFKSLSNCRSVQAITRQGCRKHGSKIVFSAF
ncbi:hypothetical protein SUGI_1126950 [Cryptomeria japonica]|nr:hypothetical protein SUGI_1126950 [Cryptomeria japonica]